MTAESASRFEVQLLSTCALAFFKKMFSTDDSLPTMAMLRCLSGFRWLMTVDVEEDYRSWMAMARKNVGTSDMDHAVVPFGEVDEIDVLFLSPRKAARWCSSSTPTKSVPIKDMSPGKPDDLKPAHLSPSLAKLPSPTVAKHQIMAALA